jgi:hypothetical protein
MVQRCLPAFRSILALICFSVVQAQVTCDAALAHGKINPVSKAASNIWKVDPFLIPPRGRCEQMPMDSDGNYLKLDFDDYPTITADCYDKVQFVMRTVGRQQRHGVYITNQTESTTFCPPPLWDDDKKCEVRLFEEDEKDTQCIGYTQLDPLIMFGPENLIIREYTTPTLRELVPAGKDTDTLVFSCPWVQGKTTATPTSHCINGMYVEVIVKGCNKPPPPKPGLVLGVLAMIPFFLRICG